MRKQTFILIKMKNSLRTYTIYWLYAASLVHVIIGFLLPWIAQSQVAIPYHNLIESNFWSGIAPAESRAMQIWWISLFGATIQNVGIWMAALVRLGDIHHSRFAWASLLLGVLVWAPQDMWISFQAGAMIHLWIDGFALITLLPVFIYLYCIDKPHALCVK